MAQSSQTGKKRVAIQLPPGVGSYVFLVEPRANQRGQMQYSLSLVYSKTRAGELEPLRRAVAEVATARFGPRAAEEMRQNRLRSPIRDGDTDRPDDRTYRGCLFVTARTNRKPMVIDAKKNEVFSEDDVYSGCLLRATVSVFAYDQQGNRGVSLGLNNVQVLKKLERIDGRKSAQEEFEEWSEEGGGDPLA